MDHFSSDKRGPCIRNWVYFLKALKFCRVDSNLEHNGQLPQLFNPINQGFNFEDMDDLLISYKIVSVSRNGEIIITVCLLLNSRSHGWRIDADEQDAHEMLNVLLTSLEEEAQKSSETVASKTASLSFYDDIIGGGDDIDDDVEDDDDDGPQHVGEEGDGARSRVSPSPPPVTTPGGELTIFETARNFTYLLYLLLLKILFT